MPTLSIIKVALITFSRPSATVQQMNYVAIFRKIARWLDHFVIRFERFLFIAKFLKFTAPQTKLG